MSGWVSTVADNPVYVGLMVFVGLYPLVTGLYWIAGALVFAFHREQDAPGFYELETFPHVSVLVPAHNEESVILETVERLLELDWPSFDVTVVDDGSTDRTSEALIPLADAGRIRLITKRINEGKAMALNDALPLLEGEIVLIVDADGRPQPDALRWMVPHFVKVPRVAAVTGNPRVANTTTLLAKLQAIEFSATISVLRRAQATWGRLMTFSGICTAFRKSAIEQVGRFEIGMATEDIALAWQLQSVFSDVRYEPRALFSMEAPEHLGAWWRQRTRWSRGLGQVLRANLRIFGDRRKRRLWPVWIEGALSTIWSHLFFLGAAFWIVALASGVYGFDGNPIPNYWGLLIATTLIVQISVGLLLDRRYDSSAASYALWMPLYPLAYWLLSAAAAVWGTIPGFLHPRHPAPVTWTQPRHTRSTPAAAKTDQDASALGA